MFVYEALLTYSVVHALELDLVLETLLELLSTQDELSSALSLSRVRPTYINLPHLSVLALDRSVHHLLVLIGQDSSRLLQHLTIVTILVSPLAKISTMSRQKRQTLTYIGQQSWSSAG